MLSMEIIYFWNEQQSPLWQSLGKANRREKIKITNRFECAISSIVFKCVTHEHGALQSLMGVDNILQHQNILM